MRFYGAQMHHRVALHKVLERGLAIKPDAIALATIDGSWTFRELDRLTDYCAMNWLAQGLQPGDRVASFLPNCSALFIHTIAAFKAGLVTVPLNYRYTRFEIDHALNVSGAKALLYDIERADQIETSAEAKWLDLRFVHGGSDPGAAPFEDLIASPAPRELPEPDPDTPAIIFFTSGSTGPAKGVTHTHRTYGHMVANFVVTSGFSSDDRFMSGSSCSHVGGSMASLSAFSEGAMVIAPRIGMLDVQVDMLRTWRPTVILMLPAALFTLEREGHVSPEDFDACRAILSGGDKVPMQLDAEFIEKTGLPIDELYGMTEMGTSHMNPSSGLVKLGTVGRTCPGFTSEIRDENGTPLPIGEEGKLFVKAASTMVYYWNRPEATAEVLDDDGWLDTGDVMRADEEGYFTFCGRKKQIIIHDGSNIFPQEVEESLLAHDAVALVGVIGIADLVHGENVRAYVELKNGHPAPTASDLIAFSRATVGYKAPEEIIFLSEMPLNPTGKVDRVALKRLAAEPSNASH